MGRPPQEPVAVACSSSHIREQHGYVNLFVPGKRPQSISPRQQGGQPPSSTSSKVVNTTPEAMIQNLSLGGMCCSSCGALSNCPCTSSSNTKNKLASSHSIPPSPYFWKRTLNNPIAKRPFKPRGSILTPPKLKLLLTTTQQQQPPTPSCSRGLFSSSSAYSCFSSPDVFIPDLSNLSLGCSNNIRLSSGSTSDLDLRLQQSLQIQSKGPPPASALRSYSRRIRTLKWKSRIKCSLVNSSSLSSSQLPTIREEDREDGEEGDDGNDEISETGPGGNNVQNKKSCSQQASSNRSEPPVDDVTIDELASYLENGVYIPKKINCWYIN